VKKGRLHSLSRWFRHKAIGPARFAARRWLGIEQRKAPLAKLLSRAAPRIQFNEHIEEDGVTVFEHACKRGCEGIGSKRKGSRYSAGRLPDWLKSKNPNSPAVRREAEEDWHWRRYYERGRTPRCGPKVVA
jgi:hypothetical protein